MSNIRLKGYLDIPPQDLQRVLRALPKHIELSRQEIGCVFFSVKQDENNSHRLIVQEEFQNQGAFDNHQQRTKSSEWASISKNCQRYFQIEE